MHTNEIPPAAAGVHELSPWDKQLAEEPPERRKERETAARAAEARRTAQISAEKTAREYTIQSAEDYIRAWRECASALAVAEQRLLGIAALRRSYVAGIFATLVLLGMTHPLHWCGWAELPYALGLCMALVFTASLLTAQDDHKETADFVTYKTRRVVDCRAHAQERLTHAWQSQHDRIKNHGFEIAKLTETEQHRLLDVARQLRE